MMKLETNLERFERVLKEREERLKADILNLPILKAENSRLLEAHRLKDIEHSGLVQQLKEKDSRISEMREALEFYAAKENYEPERKYGPFGYDVHRIITDAGFKARKALKGESES